MLDFGFSEILLTSAIALVVLGPEKLPKVARQVGNWMGRARLMARQLSEQLEREVNAEELLRQQTKTHGDAALDRSRADWRRPPPTAPVAPRVPPPTRRGHARDSPAPSAHPNSAAAMHPATRPRRRAPTPQQSTQ